MDLKITPQKNVLTIEIDNNLYFKLLKISKLQNTNVSTMLEQVINSCEFKANMDNLLKVLETFKR